MEIISRAYLSLSIARFYDEDSCLERMYEKKFFRNLKPYESAIEEIKETIANENAEFYCITAVIDSPHCIKEKQEWLDEYLPEIDRAHRIFTQFGEKKPDYVPGGITETDVLLDDYTKNLMEWEAAGGVGIKAINNINNLGKRGPTWNKLRYNVDKEKENV